MEMRDHSIKFGYNYQVAKQEYLKNKEMIKLGTSGRGVEIGRPTIGAGEGYQSLEPGQKQNQVRKNKDMIT